jgi:hypothetical protein
VNPCNARRLRLRGQRRIGGSLLALNQAT